MRFNTQNFSVAGLILGFLLIYVPTYTTPFVMDDAHTIQTNQFVHSLKYFLLPWTTAKAYSSSPENYGYRPVTINFSQLCWAVGQGSVIPFQVAKKFLLILFASLCFLVWREWLRIRGEMANKLWWGNGLLAFGFFLFHPVGTQVGNYIAATSTLLCSIFYLLGFYFYLKYRRENTLKYLIFAGIGYFLAVMSKEEGITLIAILLIAEYFFLRSRQKMSMFAVGFLIAVGLIAVYIVSSNFEATSNIARGSISRELYFATQLRAYFFYMGSYVWPFQYNFDHLSFQFAKQLWTFTNALFLFLNAAWLGFGFFLCAKKKSLGLAIVGFYIAVAPASSVIPLAEAVNDHRDFIPFIFFGFGMILVLEMVLSKITKTEKQQLIAKHVLLVFLAMATLLRNFDYISNRSLWTDTVLKNPQSPRAKNNLALDYMAKAEYGFAKLLLTKCIEEAEYYYPCFINYAVISSATGDTATAEEFFKKAIPMDHNLISSRMFYADFLTGQGRDSEARTFLEEANQFAHGLNKPVVDRLEAIDARSDNKK